MIPEKCKAPTAANDRGPEEQTETDAAIVAQPADSRKEQATLAARLALQNYTLHELAGGGFLISRWDRTAHCSDLGAVAGFLRQIGAQ